MGHYRAEMMCNTCGETRCVCPVDDTPDPSWIVDDDYKPIRVVDFDKTRQMPMLHRYRRKHFATEKEAAAHAIVLKRQLLETFRESLKETKKRIKKLEKELND